jgi:acyl-CoA synthetase (AMP-forming)/AMP-acid ligase II
VIALAEPAVESAAVARAAAVWRDCGLETGETVAVRLVDRAESEVACRGAMAAGGVPVLLDANASALEWMRQWSRARWRFVLVESRSEHPAAMRDFLMTREEWLMAMAEIAAAAPARGCV